MRSAGGRIVSVLEGGYDLQGLQESVAAHVTALMGTTSKPECATFRPQWWPFKITGLIDSRKPSLNWRAI